MPLQYSYNIVVTPNTEDPEVGGYFASFAVNNSLAPGWGRGHGSTRLSAMFSLVLLYAENQEESLGEQANDLIASMAMPNQDLEKALERHYDFTIPALGIE